MNPSEPSFWKNYRISIVAVLTALVVLLVQYRVEHRDYEINRLHELVRHCAEINDAFYGAGYPFAPADPAERRRIVVSDILDGSGIEPDRFNREIKDLLKAANRLKISTAELAHLAHAAGDLPLAENAARQLLEDPAAPQPESQIILADILYSAKKFSEAEAAYRKVIIYPNGQDSSSTYNRYQRLAGFYADEKTYTSVRSDSGREFPKPDVMEWRQMAGLSSWDRVVSIGYTPNSGFLDLPERERTFIANASIQIGHFHRALGRIAEARNSYLQALAAYRHRDGSETDNTKKTQQLIDALPAATATPNKQ